MNFLQLLEEQLRQQRPAFQPTAVEGLLQQPQQDSVQAYSPETFVPEGLLNRHTARNVARGAGLLGLGFAPGAGVGDYAGQFPSFQGGLEPGFAENVEQGNYGTAALQSLGAFGDLAMTVPVLGAVVGSAAKAPRAIQRATRMRGEQPSVMPQVDDLGFYSQVEKSLLDIPQQKGTGEQFLAQLQKSPGVRPEEIQYTGLDRFLASRPSVTKAEVQDYLDANRVQVQEVTLQAPTDPSMSISHEVAGLNPKFEKYTIPGGENYREVLLTLPESGDVYRSSHFDQPNILAHMRVNDRTVDGKRTMFIEEVQSDWHQAGRKQGYQDQNIRSVSEIDRELDSVVNELRSMPDVGYVPTEQDWARHPEITARHEQLVAERSLASQSKTGVPDAPFKSTWDELTLKRAIKMASDEGYEQIAFTTGRTQADRYDLSKHVENISYGRNQDGTYSLTATAKNNRPAIYENNIPEAQLENIVGKEVAQKIIAGEGTPFPRNSISEGKKSLSGLDLQVGGEGMIAFYDRMLPKKLEKIGKKYGAKPTKSTMQTPDGEVEVWTFDIPADMRETVREQGLPLFQIGAGAAGLGAGGLLATEEEQY